MIWKSDLPFYCNTFWLVAWTVGGVWLSAELDTGSMLSWYLQVEGWGCWFVQSENPCFGTCTKLGIINKNHSNVGLCLVPVTGHKPFSSTSPFKLAQKLLCAYAELGTSRLRAFLTLFQRWSECELWHHPSPHAGDFRPWLRFSSKAGGWQRWQLRDSAEYAETELSLTGEGESSKADWQHSFSKWTSKRNMHVLIFPSLPTGRCFRSLLFQPFAEKSASPVGSCCVHPVGYSARTMKSANLRLVFKSREVEREDTWLNPAVNGW